MIIAGFSCDLYRDRKSRWITLMPTTLTDSSKVELTLARKGLYLVHLTLIGG